MCGWVYTGVGAVNVSTGFVATIVDQGGGECRWEFHDGPGGTLIFNGDNYSTTAEAAESLKLMLGAIGGFALAVTGTPLE